VDEASGLSQILLDAKRSVGRSSFQDGIIPHRKRSIAVAATVAGADRAAVTARGGQRIAVDLAGPGCRGRAGPSTWEEALSVKPAAPAP